MTGHRFHSPKNASWLKYCIGCGHVPLNNGISRLVTKLGCDYADAPQFKAWVAAGRKPIREAA